MTTERDVLFKLRAENSDLRAKLAQSTGDLEAFKAANAAVAPGATAAAAALAGEAAASTAAGAAAGGHAAQQDIVVVALREARDAMRRFTAESVVGGVSQEAAARSAAKAIAQVQIAIAEARATGGIVTPAQIAAVETYTARLQGTVAPLAQVGAAASATAAQKGLLASATSAAGRAAVSGTASFGGLAARLLTFLGPVGTVLAVITLIPAAIKLVIDKTNEWSTKLGEMIAGLNEQDGVVRKSGESMEAYTKRANESADAQAKFDRAVKAADAGIIENTGNVQEMSAAYVLHQAAARGNVPPTKEFEAAAKALGITLTQTYSGATRNAVETFLAIYAAKLRESKASAEEFAVANKGTIESWMQQMANAKESIPPVLADLSAKLGTLTTQQRAVKDELEKSIAPLRDYWDWMNKAREATGAFAVAQKNLVEQSATFTFDAITGRLIDKEGLQNALDLVDRLVSGLSLLPDAARKVNETEIDFEVVD